MGLYAGWCKPHLTLQRLWQSSRPPTALQRIERLLAVCIGSKKWVRNPPQSTRLYDTITEFWLYRQMKYQKDTLCFNFQTIKNRGHFQLTTAHDSFPYLMVPVNTKILSWYCHRGCSFFENTECRYSIKGTSSPQYSNIVMWSNPLE